MTYRGHVQNGVVVLDGSPAIEEGTIVNVEPVAAAAQPRIGSAEAIMQCAGTWEGEADEFDRLLADLKDMKRADVDAQLRQIQQNARNPLDAA